MSDPTVRCRPGQHLLYRYEVRIRTTLTPALAASFARIAGRAVVPRHAIRRLALIRDADDTVDLPAVRLRLAECDVAVLDARPCLPATTRESRDR
jgi:hypothetical protein